MPRHLPAFQLVYNLRYKMSDPIYISTNVSYLYTCNVNYTLIEMLGDVSARSELELELE